MELSEKNLETVGSYVKGNLASWLKEVVPHATSLLDPSLMERVVKIESSLDRQQALMQQGFEQVDKRFEEMREDFTWRFEQIDKRFEQVYTRFEQIDKRFEQVDKRFEEMREDFTWRFEQIDKRFENTRNDFTTHFEELRLQGKRQTTLLTVVLSALTLLVAYGTFIG